MKRSRTLLLLVLVAALVSGVWYMTQSANTPASLLEKALNLAGRSGVTSFDGSKLQSNATNANPLEEAVGLAIKNINLFQGNKGVELWRLNASWAHLSQNGEIINVDSPVIHYALGEGSVSNPGDDILDVQAHKGRVTDNQRYLTLWDDVVITRYADTLTGQRMDYDAPTRTMVFPEGAALDSPTASGTAKVFKWDLGKNEMYASDGVLVVLKPRQPKTTEVAPAVAPGIVSGVAAGVTAGVTAGVAAGVAAGVVKGTTPGTPSRKATTSKTSKMSNKKTDAKKTGTPKASTKKAATTKASAKKTSGPKTPTTKPVNKKKTGTSTSATTAPKTGSSVKSSTSTHTSPGI